jgi:hypothetical protein
MFFQHITVEEKEINGYGKKDKNKPCMQLSTNNLSSLMMEAVRTSETSVDNHFTRQYIPEDNSEHHTSRRENLKSNNLCFTSLNIRSFILNNHLISK